MVLKEDTTVCFKVLHSQQTEKPLQPWIVTEMSGKILAANCDCMAGLGKACMHISTLLFYVEVTVRMQETRAISQLCYCQQSKEGIMVVCSNEPCTTKQLISFEMLRPEEQA